jgi:hypothetical protein
MFKERYFSHLERRPPPQRFDEGCMERAEIYEGVRRQIEV